MIITTIIQTNQFTSLAFTRRKKKKYKRKVNLKKMEGLIKTSNNLDHNGTCTTLGYFINRNRIGFRSGRLHSHNKV
jgi:hypothetical protein